jgi:RHS repeat-associated protein
MIRKGNKRVMKHLTNNSLKAAAAVLRLTALAALLFALFAVAALADGTVSPDRGFSPGKSYRVSDIETLSLESGNLMLNVPTGALPSGRAGSGAGVSIQYNSKLWDVELNGDGQTATAMLWPDDDGGWKYGNAYSIRFDTDCGRQNGNPYKLSLVMPDGGRHLLWMTGHTDPDGNVDTIPDGYASCTVGSPSSQGAVSYYTIDGSYLKVDFTGNSDASQTGEGWTVSAPDGTKITYNPDSIQTPENSSLHPRQKITDRNGNSTSWFETATDASYSNHRTTRVRDDMGRETVIEYGAGTGGADLDKIYSKGTGGADLVTRVLWKTAKVNKQYHLCQFGSTCIGNDLVTFARDLRVVDKIYLPQQAGDPNNADDLYYSFGYNADSDGTTASTGWGEVNSVTTPSGAETDYQYKWDAYSAGDLHAFMLMDNRPIQKTLHFTEQYDGSTANSSETWTYSASSSTFSSGQSYTTQAAVTAPDGSQSTEYYTGGTGGYYSGITLYKSVSGDGTVTEYASGNNLPASDPNKLTLANNFQRFVFTSIPDASGTLVKTTVKEQSIDKNGNVTQTKEYGFFPYSGTGSVQRDSNQRPTGVPSGAVPLRITNTDYYNDTPDSQSTTYTDGDSYHISTNPRLLNLVKSTEVQDGSNNPKSRTEINYDYTSYSTNTIGGNATETKSWDSNKGGSTQAYSNPLTTTNSESATVSYNSHGMPTLTTDANGNSTQITYGSINGYTDLYPTQVIAAYNTSVAQTQQMAYDFYTGAQTSVTALGNTSGENVTTTTTYDDLGRPTKVAAAYNTASEIWTQTEYDDANRRVTVKSDLETKGDAKKVSTQFYDQLGRVRLAKTLEDAATQSASNESDGIKVQTRYKTTSGYSYQLSSNPYRASTSANASSENTMGWTRSKAASSGIHSETETFSGAGLPAPWGSNSSSTGVVTTDKDADRVLVTDQAGKQRISKSNALGQLTDVWEILAASDGNISTSVTFPNTSVAYGYQTSYQYDPLNNLTTVNQGSQQQNRTFGYSSLSRLLTASNPESGTISYGYDNNGNLSAKTDARSITSSYTYDALNRATQRSYSGITMPTVTYTYDDPAVPFSRGKLTKVASILSSANVSTTEYTGFDILGRVTSHKQTTAGGDSAGYATSYLYNLSGALIEETYPSGRKVKYTVNSIGELSQVQSKKDSNSGYWAYAKAFTYNAAGAVSSMQLGNGHWESTIFNARLQPTEIALGTTPNATNLLKLDYSYGTTANNGNIGSQTITVPTVGTNTGFIATQNYNYDSLNRLKDATENITPTGGSSTQSWKQTFTFDRYGNRNFDEANTTTIPRNCTGNTICVADRKALNPAISTSTNRIVQDQDNDTVNDYIFDSAGNTTKDASGKTFTYDGENKQTEVKDSNNNTVGQYVYDGDGKRVKKTVDATGETTIFVYDASGVSIAEYSTIVSTTPQISYLTSDNLGSPRINTDHNGAVTARHDYMPFGEEVSSSQRTPALGYVADDVRKKFTGYENDSESELDYAQARYYKSQHGRFTSVDPTMASADIINPQSFNRYIYVGNNPLNITDPTGEIWGRNGDTIQWFDTEKDMKAAGFTASSVLTGYRDGQLYALDPNSNNYVPVASATLAIRQLSIWGAEAGIIEASAVSLGLVGAGVSANAILAQIYASDPALPAPIVPIGGDPQAAWVADLVNQIFGFERNPMIAHNQQWMNNATAGNGNSGTNLQGETSPADPNSVKPDPNDNKPTYESNPKHAATDRGNVSRQPSDGSGMLEHSIEVNSKTRIAVDRGNNEIVVFRGHGGNRYHGYVSSWNRLPNNMKAILRRERLVTSRGKIK